MGNKCLPDNLKGKRHDDLIWILRWIPRSWSARCGKRWPQPPKLLLGNSGWTAEDAHIFGHHNTEDHTAADFLRANGDILPVPKAGHGFVSAVMWSGWLPLVFWARSFKGGGMISWGLVRWDDVDKYYDIHRVRVSGWRGRLAAAAILAVIAALIYWVLK